MNNGCLGCNHIETAPHTLRTGRVVCIGCKLRTEEDAAVLRHVENLHRCQGVQSRRHYLERVHANEGEKVRIAVESQFLVEWKAKQGIR